MLTFPMESEFQNSVAEIHTMMELFFYIIKCFTVVFHPSVLLSILYHNMNYK